MRLRRYGRRIYAYAAATLRAFARLMPMPRQLMPMPLRATRHDTLMRHSDADAAAAYASYIELMILRRCRQPLRADASRYAYCCFTMPADVSMPLCCRLCMPLP